MSKKQRMRGYDARLKTPSISGVSNGKRKKKGRESLKSNGGKKRRHENER